MYEIKKSLLDSEEEKKTLLRGIASKLEELNAKFGRVIGLQEWIAKDQSQLCSLLASQTHPSFTPQPAGLFSHLPITPPHYPPNTD